MEQTLTFGTSRDNDFVDLNQRTSGCAISTPLHSAGDPPRAAGYVTSLFAAIAAAQPAHPAVVANGFILTYGQLESQSSALARQLQRSGVGRNSLIGLVANRSVAHIVGALGILNAVPLICR